ncbi:CdaR family protein [Paenibacillus sp. M1]|uniref:CdaR family protein n=1 Tax=Paenibacillus haidiansis TaxID=1574488 RepID=A0ABU7VWV0_9BACL
MDKWINHNNIAKVIALVVSVMLWMMVHLDSGTPVAPTTVVNTKTIDTKIQITGFDSDKYVLYDLERDTVRLEVKGKRTDLTTNFSDYKVKLDLKGIGPGTITLPLEYELPPGVQLVSMEPSIIKVTIEAKETVDMPVTIVTTGSPADEMQLGSPIVNGAGTVKVTLPQSEIGELQKVQGTVDVTGLTESVKGKSVKLTAYDKQGQEMSNAEISPDTVDVDVPINKLYKTVPIEVRKTGQLPDGYVLSGITTNVEGVAVYGSKDVLEGISSYPVTVDLGQFQGTDETRYTVDLTPPEGFEKIEPSSVQITVTIEPAGQKLIDHIPVTLINLEDSLTEKFIDPADSEISLTVRGAKDVLDKLKAEDITATADLAGLGPGTHTIPVSVVLPEYIVLNDPNQRIEVQIELTASDKPASSVPEENNGGDAGAQNNGNGGNGGNGGNVGNGSNAVEEPAQTEDGGKGETSNAEG